LSVAPSTAIKTIINLVDLISPVNYGIWHAAIATAGFLAESGVETWLVGPLEPGFSFPAGQFPYVRFKEVQVTSIVGAQAFFSEFDPAVTVVASHGCWQYPTRWGSYARTQGFRWIYTPHGMLEPWSMAQKWLKKKIYFLAFERPMARRASHVRAVGSPELANLQKHFSQASLIPNGIYPTELQAYRTMNQMVQVLYLARLHHKKGVIPMVEAWKKSLLWKNTHYQLTIAGTDDGELAKLQAILSRDPGNIRYVGAVFGTEKQKLFSQSAYYILPSLSEGFPTSVLEAMAAGLVPMITPGCNFPEAFDHQVAIPTMPTVNEIQNSFDSLVQIDANQWAALSKNCRDFVAEHYTWPKIATMQLHLYQTPET